MPDRVMLPPAPILRLSADRVRLDIKFKIGMDYTCANWPGQIDCIFRDGTDSIPFGADYDIDDLPFGVTILEADAPISPDMVAHYDIVEASGDLHHDLGLSVALAGSGTKVVYVVEYDLKTRLQIVWLQPDATLFQKLKSTMWTLNQERLRRRAFSAAAALQLNGFPARDRYGGLSNAGLMYIDNRMTRSMLATPDEQESRKSRLRSGAALRLINSGRLEPMKGAQDLIPLSRRLLDKGVQFTLDIYGTGSLETQIRAEIDQYGLHDHVRLHAPVDFETELVPISRQSADIFVSCHRQSDPSCTYIEAMGCGLPVVGYANDMLRQMLTASDAGWSVKLGDVSALSDEIARIATDTAAIEQAGDAALAFATRHDFEAEFTRRRDHLLSLKASA